MLLKNTLVSVGSPLEDIEHPLPLSLHQVQLVPHRSPHNLVGVIHFHSNIHVEVVFMRLRFLLLAPEHFRLESGGQLFVRVGDINE